MSFATYPVLQAAQAMLEASLNVQESNIGEPDVAEYRVFAYSMLGGQSMDDEAAGWPTGGQLVRESEVFVGLAYRVDGKKAEAERVICETVDDFTRRFYADRTLGDTCENGRLDMGLNARPIYGDIDGQMCRIYLIRVLFDQRDTITSS
jgi:hypothetical protein